MVDIQTDFSYCCHNTYFLNYLQGKTGSEYLRPRKRDLDLHAALRDAPVAGPSERFAAASVPMTSGYLRAKRQARRLGLVGPFVTHCLGHLGPRYRCDAGQFVAVTLGACLVSAFEFSTGALNNRKLR